MQLNSFLYISMIVLMLSACGNEDDSGNNGNGVADEIEAIPVQTHIVQLGDVAEIVAATGTLFPFHDALVSSETAGKIIEIHVEVGDPVTAEAALIQIDTEMKQLALDQAEAKFLEAKAASDKAYKDFERNQKLHQTKDISDYLFEQARLQKESASAGLLMANANVKMARRMLSDAAIKSPFDGLVAARLVELGATVAPGTPIVKIVDISKIKVKFGVSERDIGKITNGQSAVFTVASFPERTFIGKVTAVGPQADLSTRTFPVHVTVDNRELRLKAGMVAQVKIEVQTLTNIPLVPKSAPFERNGETIVFILENNMAHHRSLKLSLEHGDFVAVREGIEAGEEVVVLGQENLVDGKVVVRN